MRNLIAFLVKNSYWFLFILLEVICFYLIFQYNSYQRSIFFNSSTELVGRVYSISGNISSYFGLKDINSELLEENTRLHQKVIDLEAYIKSTDSTALASNAFLTDSISQNRYSYTVARVLDNSVSRVHNYIVIDKGENDGIIPEMGVISKTGIVGFVRYVSPNFSLVQSILNPKTQLNCKIKGSNIPTTLVWNAKNYQYADLKDFPRFEKFEEGDTVITSGVSTFFPEGFNVGIIEGFDNQKDDNFYTLRVKLATNFSTLSEVLVINNYHRKELTGLRKEVENEQ